MHGAGTGRPSTPGEVTHNTAAGKVPPDTPPPVGPVVVDLVVPLTRDITYDHTLGQARMPVDVVLTDGSTRRAELVLNSSQMYAAAIKLERAIDAREGARSLGSH